MRTRFKSENPAERFPSKPMSWGYASSDFPILPAPRPGPSFLSKMRSGNSPNPQKLSKSPEKRATAHQNLLSDRKCRDDAGLSHCATLVLHLRTRRLAGMSLEPPHCTTSIRISDRGCQGAALAPLYTKPMSGFRPGIPRCRTSESREPAASVFFGTSRIGATSALMPGYRESRSGNENRRNRAARQSRTANPEAKAGYADCGKSSCTAEPQSSKRRREPPDRTTPHGQSANPRERAENANRGESPRATGGSERRRRT